MEPNLSRRHWLATSGALLASCRLPHVGDDGGKSLDGLLASQVEGLPERDGASANHFPMAAEVLETFGCVDRIPVVWTRQALGYVGAVPRQRVLRDAPGALGSYDRYGDWLDAFVAELDREDWRATLAHWIPTLAPGVSAAAFHGLLRTAHAVRALQRHDTAARRRELAIGLAYWAARHAELRVTSQSLPTSGDLIAFLHDLDYSRAASRDDVPFGEVGDRLALATVAPVWNVDAVAGAPMAAIQRLVVAAGTVYLELFASGRHRLWLLHTITGPAAVALLLPFLTPRDGARLVAFVQQAVVAMFAAFGAPFQPGHSLVAAPRSTAALVDAAVASGSVHTLKLIEALTRFDAGNEAVGQSVAERWLDWK